MLSIPHPLVASVIHLPHPPPPLHPQELSLEISLPIAKAVAEANVMMGIEPQGPLARQVETLLTQLGVIS